MAYPRADREPVAPVIQAAWRTSALRILRSACAATLVTLVLALRAGHAGPFEVVAGWEGDNHAQGYGFLTLGAVLPAGHRIVVPVRASGSFLYYTYDSSGTSIRVRSPGVSLLTGPRVSGPGGSATLLGGGEVRWDHRETNVPPGSTRDVATAGIVVQGDGELALTPRWRALALANYAGAAKYVYGRGAIRYQATNIDWQGPTSLFVGAEGVRQGNDESDSFQGGGLVECSLVPQHLSLALHGGYKESWSPRAEHRRGTYVGLSVYRAF